MAKPDRRYVSFDELLAYRQELDREELIEAAKNAEATAPVEVNLLGEPDDGLDDPGKLSWLFRALGNELRMEIVLILVGRPASAGDIAYELERKPSHLSRHL